MIIKSNKEGLLGTTIPTGKNDEGFETGKEVIILPGYNDIEVPDIPAFKAKLQLHFDSGMLSEAMMAKIDGNGKSKKKPAEFVKMSPAEAKEIIAETVNINTLEKWIDKEERNDVRLLLEKQIAVVKVEKE